MNSLSKNSAQQNVFKWYGCPTKDDYGDEYTDKIIEFLNKSGV